MRKIIVYFNSTLPHFSQLLTGLEYLRENNQIQLRYELEKFKYPPYIFKIDKDGTSIFFDLSDNSAIHSEIYDRSDFYVKRMLLKKDLSTHRKLIPFGLNYQVFYRNKFLKYLFLKDKKLLKYSLRYSNTASLVLNIKDCVRNNELNLMQSGPAKGKQILFRTRLWNPDNSDIKWKQDEREIMNRERIELNESLNLKFRKEFRGGIQKDDYSVRRCPTLLLPKQEYHKKNYLRVLKKSSIGIMSCGLEKSISWKFGEYISHGMAVLSNPIQQFQLLGPLLEGEHYLTYRSISECLEKIDLLLLNHSLRESMQTANREYYMNWLHPGRKIMKILDLTENP